MADDNIYDTLPAESPPAAPSSPPAGDSNIYDVMPAVAAQPEAPTSPRQLFDYANQPPLVDQASSAFTDIWPETKQAASDAISSVASNLNPFSDERHATYARQAAAPTFLGGLKEEIGQLGSTGSGIVSIAGVPGALATGPSRSIGGHFVSAVEGIPYEDAKGQVDTAMEGLAPGRGGIRPSPIPPTKPVTGPLGVTQSVGQATQDLSAIQLEQAAGRGVLGDNSLAIAKAFNDQQAGQVAAAREGVGNQFDANGITYADNPQQAGQLASQGIQAAKNSAKGTVDNLYDTARNLPGEIHSGVFENIGSKIKNDLTNPSGGQKQVIVDEDTKEASKAIKYLDDRVSNLRITNAADPAGPPNPQNIVGVNLAGVDQWRKHLSTLRDNAFGRGDLTDGRAMQAIMNSFDRHVDAAVNSSAFTGSPTAAQAWNNARAAHAQYRSNFFDQGTGDAIGKAMEKIAGTRNAPPATPNDVADIMYGATGTNPSSVNVGVVNRVRDILGPNSPEWSGIKQGLFSRIVEPASAGNPPLSSAQIAKRANDFLTGNGKEMADAVYSPAEKQLVQSYADLHKSMIVPQAGAQWSNNASFIRQAADKVGMYVGAIIGGRVLGNTVPLLGEAAGAYVGKQIGKIGEFSDARKVARQMPLVADQMAKYNKALGAYNKANTPISAAGLGFAKTNLTSTLGKMGINMDGDGAPSRAAGGRVVVSGVNPRPTEAQKKAGNYAKGHVRVHGLDITVENAKGSHRSGIGPDGKTWKTKMPAHYGYVKGTVGADKDHVDVYLGPHHRSSRVFVIDQKNAQTGEFDEHKAFVGFANRHYVEKTYHAAFSDGKGAKRFGALTEMPLADFKKWLEHGDTTKPVAQKR